MRCADPVMALLGTQLSRHADAIVDIPFWPCRSRRGGSRRRHGRHGSNERRRLRSATHPTAGDGVGTTLRPGSRRWSTPSDRRAACSRLAVSPTLAASSRWKSLHMAAEGYFAHDDAAPPVSRSAHERALDCGYGGARGARTSASATRLRGPSSRAGSPRPGHRANIENPGFTSTGVGVAASGSGRLYWTQNFGDDVSAGPPARDSRSRLARGHIRPGRR